jgi:peptidoglycan/xylan/chitin deacetylase (PgdA/CDA1 family)
MGYGYVGLVASLLSITCPVLGLTSYPVRTIALTFDDLPVGGPVPRPDRAGVFSRILLTLERERVPAIGFVNELQLRPQGRIDSAEVALLRAWLGAGLALGNHSYSHPDLHRTRLAEFERDVLEGETLTRPLLAKVGKQPRFFRHPFLHTGRSVAIRDSLLQFLAAHGYRVAPVTDDNSDWIFSLASERALQRGDSSALRAIEMAYVPYMERKLDYWERQSVALFGREIPQVMLLHINRINADRLGYLIAMLRGRGYRLIPLEEAIADSAYGTSDSYAGPAGISWLHRWALTRGREYLVPDEPKAPAEVLSEAGVKSE